ncbi:hypothetical protein PTSG_08912 [Salpingoeca rosetta]|uniref:Anaphase-promoting complex subunit 4 WD40 domain-containing protein n=1 Tax=Salpingoeca rosetta (strain ATCC 50818 / BSB-021) TaxID=946362 RepID=F2UL23_SALR5|nr:uncharacterized protein PTSG_08912 [Salpingoeca rosetta]EGD77822.1 hypothetical protein PTSG_08912 [Salpingoeca rosetta]|eukprot:XP_004990298.1 hypothetical protein PTSG_08912 [Salpingoeca rosetta]
MEVLVSADCDGAVRRWGTDGSSVCILPPHKEPVNVLRADNAANRVFLGKHKQVMSIDLVTNQSVLNVEAHKSNVLDVDWCAPVSLLFTAGEDSHLKAIDPKSDAVMNVMDLSNMRVPINTLRVFEDRLYVGDNAGFLHVLDVRNLKQALATRGLSSSGIVSLDIAPTGHTCALDDDGAVFFWTPSRVDGAVGHHAHLPIDQASSCRFTSDGRVVVTSALPDVWVFAGASGSSTPDGDGTRSGHDNGMGNGVARGGVGKDDVGMAAAFTPLFRLAGLQRGAWSSCTSSTNQYIFVGCEDASIAVYDLSLDPHAPDQLRSSQSADLASSSLSSSSSSLSTSSPRRKTSLEQSNAAVIPEPSWVWKGHEFDVVSVTTAIAPS